MSFGCSVLGGFELVWLVFTLFVLLLFGGWGCVVGVAWWWYLVLRRVKNGGLKIVKNGPRVWAFCKIEFPGIQKPVQILTQKSGFFRNPGNRGVGVIWLVRGLDLAGWVLG